MVTLLILDNAFIIFSTMVQILSSLFYLHSFQQVTERTVDEERTPGVNPIIRRVE